MDWLGLALLEEKSIRQLNWLVGFLVGWLWLAYLVGWLTGLAGWFGLTRQRLVPSPGALTEREVGGGQWLSEAAHGFVIQLEA